MEYNVRTDLARSAGIVALGVAASVVLSTALAARAYRGRAVDASRRIETLDVKGLARQRIMSDVAVWRIDVKGEGETLQASFAALEKGLGGIRAFLNERSFEEGEIVIGAIRTETHYARDGDGRRTRDVTGYTLQRSVSVTSGALERVATAAGKVTELIREGILVVSQPPEYYYSRVADLKIALMGMASEDARARADAIARKAGCRVGAVRDARMGVLQVTRPHSMDVSSYGVYDTSTIAKDVRAVVSLTFQIEN